ncbi:FAD binding domain-containing protein [Paenibacillus sp. GP183]|uniref:FAD binding domain-containing protein n=1 Tax=Paenibacillus sp. GP183 TaxID=1882751 RepID=UPI00089D9B9F|nr:FAD binding domain-containing protein [Paenibacillus sp. GP183]SEB52225.1 carbon-monoxide dehydrogenase medium subunit [Paenibacillus sp. GP183]
MALSNESYAPAPSVWEPDSIGEAWRLQQMLGLGSKFISGGTLLRTQWESGISEMPHHLISVAAIAEMSAIQIKADEAVIGAAVSLSECAKHPHIQAEFAHLVQAIRSIAAPSIRNMATLGGNIISAVGDSIPALLVSGAVLNWYGGSSRQTELLQDWVYAISQPGYQEKRLLISVSLPQMSSERLGRYVSFYQKIGRREAFTPSIVTTAFQGWIHADGGLADFHIAAGGGSSYCLRLTQSEALLNGSRLTPNLLQQLQQAVQEQMIAYSDPFASAAYRKKTAANLISSGLWSELAASS